MTLDEAIKHCEDVAEDRCGCAEDCVEEHRQLAEWLKELRERRAKDEPSNSEIPNNCEDFFREPTAEERKAVADYIDSISVPTGVNVFDLMDEPTISKMEQVDKPYIDIETGILHWCGWKYRRIYEDEQITSKQTDVENSMVSGCESTMSQPKSKLKDEPQTDCYVSDLCKHYGDKQICGRCRNRNLFAEAEPQPRCPKCGKRGYIRSLESMGVKLKAFDEYKWKCTNCNKYFKEEPKDEPQTDCAWR